MRITLIFFSLIYLTCTVIFSQENYIVRDISFSGNSAISDNELLDQMTHFATGWFSDVILFEDPFLFSKDIFEKDKSRIVQHYQRNGFINAEISNVNLYFEPEETIIEIEIEIDENEPVLIDEIKLIFNEDRQSAFFSNLTNSLKLTKGLRFTEQFLNDDKNSIIESALNNGYPYTTIDYVFDLDTTRNLLDINWIVDLGKYSKFGKIEFEGNVRTDEELLLEKVRFKSGDEYKFSKLDSTQRSIYDLGLFYIVSVKSDFESESDLIPIRIKLEEAPKYHTKFGIGYGRDEKFRVSLEERIISFLGGARQLKIYAKHSSLEPYHFRLDFFQPDFINEFTNLTVSPYLIKQTEPAFELNKLGLDLILQRPLLENIIGSFKYSIERSNLDTNSISREELEIYDLVSVYNKSSIEIGFERSTYDPVFDPSEGSFSSLVLNYTGLGIKSKYHFIRPSIEYRRYIQTAPWLIFAFRIKAGAIFSYDDDEFVPYEERFYSGGSSSVRGWGRAELGPEDNKGQPIGGKSVFESNLEFRYHIYSLFSGVAFLDYGNVWSNELTYKIDDLRYSAGWGLRVRTPIGPVRFDLAIPIFEGAARVQYFLSVGHAF